MRIFLSILFIGLWQNLHAQKDMPISILDQVEAYTEDLEEAVDITELNDRLHILFLSPLDINKVTSEELHELRLLSNIQIDDLMAHRESYGDYIRVEELQSIPSFEISDIQRIRYFLNVEDIVKLPISVNRMVQSSRQDLFLKWGQTLEDKRGYLASDDESPNYLGDKNKLFLRYRANYENKLRYGFTLEKDEGEQLLSDTINKGLDYLTAHFYIKEYSRLFKDIAIGDYTVSLGQGLITHTGFGGGKSAWVTNVKRGGRALRPYNSVTENGYNRGIATTLRPASNFEVTLFGSRTKRDGNLKVDTLDMETPDIFFSSLQTSGNHRTLAEKEDKGVIGVRSLGGSIKYIRRKGHVALNQMNSQLSRDLIRSDDAYNRFRFRGAKISNTSIDYSYRLRNVHLYGESAFASTGGLAHLVGALVGLDRRMSLAILYRNYDADYNALAPRAFGESTTVNNERALYMGLELNLNKHWKIRTYADVWRNPWLRARVANPSNGKEYLVRVDYTIKRKIQLYAQYFYEQKQENESYDDLPESFSLSEGKLNVGQIQSRQKLRIHFSNKVSKALEFRTRVEFSWFNDINGLSKGYLLFQDVIFRPIQSKLSFTARYALFDTDNYDSRIYAYENSILYDFSIPAFSDQGFRYYVNIRYRALRNLSLELRWARTYKRTGTLGSGNENIPGDTRSDVKVQIKYSF